MVQAGYPRCPRCSMPLPENVARHETVAGGTAVGQESQRSLWLGLAALAVLILGVGYAATRGDDEKPDAGDEWIAQDPEPEEETETPAARAPSNAAGDGEQVGISLDEEGPPSEAELRAQALKAFERSLSDQRLWSTLEPGPETLNIISGACRDDAMQPTIAQSAQALKAVGLTTVVCLEKHGAKAFEQGL